MKKKEIKKQYAKEILQKLKANVKLEEIIEKDFSLEKLGRRGYSEDKTLSKCKRINARYEFRTY